MDKWKDLLPRTKFLNLFHICNENAQTIKLHCYKSFELFRSWGCFYFYFLKRHAFWHVVVEWTFQFLELLRPYILIRRIYIYLQHTDKFYSRAHFFFYLLNNTEISGIILTSVFERNEWNSVSQLLNYKRNYSFFSYFNVITLELHRPFQKQASYLTSRVLRLAQ